VSDGPSVAITRDDWGTPHVRAATEEAAFYGVGYAQAEDHLDRLLRNWLWVRGETATALGESGVELDVAQRRWCHLEESRQAFGRLSTELQRNHRAFVAGVGRYLADHPDEVPSWAPTPDPALSVGVFRTLFWLYAIADGFAACRRAGVDLAGVATEDAMVRSLVASNEWVVHPDRTAEGGLALLSDPHGDLSGAAEPFQVIIEGGRIHSMGISLVGAALPLWGHTRDVAWALTTGGPSVSDCYVVEIDADRDRYRFDAGWRTLARREVVIAQRDGEPVRRTLEYTDHNGIACPVIGRQDNLAFAVCTPYMHVAHLFEEQLYRWHLAPTAADAVDAMRPGGTFVQNVLIGDRHGGIAYVRAGRVPIRAPGVDWRQPVPGNTSATAWRGVHPLDDLVQVRDPATGFLQNCNVAPDTMVRREDVAALGLDAGAHPDYIYNDTPGRTTTRGRRAVELIGRNPVATVDDIVAWTLDQSWVDVEVWQRALETAIEGEADAAPLGFTGAILGFDGVARADSREALAYLYWRRAIATTPITPELLRECFNHVEAGELTDDDAALLLDAARRAESRLVEEHGTTDLRLGDICRVGRGAESWPGGGVFHLARPGVGDEPLSPLVDSPLRLMEYGAVDEHGQRRGFWGARGLSLVIFTDPIRSYSCLGFGQSGRRDSPHFSDQSRLFSDNRLRPTYFDDLAGLEAVAEGTVTLAVPAEAEMDGTAS